MKEFLLCLKNTWQILVQFHKNIRCKPPRNSKVIFDDSVELPKQLNCLYTGMFQILMIFLGSFSLHKVHHRQMLHTSVE